MASKACAWAWRASQAALVVRSLPTNARDRRGRARSLRREDPLEWGRQPTPVFFPGEANGQKSLVVCGPSSQTRLKRRSSSMGSGVHVGISEPEATVVPRSSLLAIRRRWGGVVGKVF